MNNPKVTLVGAGPGSPDLITIRGLHALKDARVVVYDALVDLSLVSLAENAIEKVYVGKRQSNHSFSQDEINNMLVFYALKYGHVVRLKGGDPFIFGRGKEEMGYLNQKGIQTEVVPGISSAFSVPGLQGIPLTYRGLSESLWVITGTTRHGTVSQDVNIAARSNATVAILMGIHHLTEILEIYLEAGKSDTPVAVIQNGSLPEERCVIGQIATIGQIVKREQIGAPAVIVIGEVVRLHSDYYHTSQEYELALD